MAATDYTVLTECVACGKSELTTTLDLGSQPLANDFLAPGSTFDSYPLKLVRCDFCFHSQLSIAVNPARLFRDYSYVSGTSETLSDYFADLTEKITQRFGSKKKILDIGSNDGSFLEKFVRTDWTSIGVDPAVNLIPESASRGVTTIPAFFDEKIAELLTNDFDVVVAMNVFAHTQNPLAILNGISRCLATNGRALIQTSQANMFTTGQFDTVYHEHISFFNVKSMKALLDRAGLSLVDVTIVPIHGMSYLWEIKKGGQHSTQLGREIDELNFGLYETKLYSDFAELARKKIEEVTEVVKDFRDNDYQIVSYGAAAKGNTFINYAGLAFDFILDDTPQKIGRMAPAGGCVVEAPSKLRDIQGQVLIVIPAWNFSQEIVSKVRNFRNNANDKFLTYYPETLLGKIQE